MTLAEHQKAMERSKKALEYYMRNLQSFMGVPAFKIHELIDIASGLDAENFEK